MIDNKLKRWKETASDLDSHKVSAVRSDLGMASCSLWKPSNEEVQQLRTVAEEEGLRMTNEANGPSVPAGTSFTVREIVDL